jgi:hypothetical protein
MVWAIYAVATFFLLMGIYALAWPEGVLRLFGTPSLTSDGRSEVRAVYGGFGIAIAAVLVLGLCSPEIARGIYLTVAMALGGMAVGRVVSRGIDGEAGPYPRLFLVVEVVLAAVLLAAFVWRPEI